MKKFLDLISEEMKQAFEASGYDRELGKVTLSNRPDLCEYQCNGAMAGAKLYKKAPLMIAQDVAEKCKDSKAFSSVEAVPPGFLNLKVKESFVTDYLTKMCHEPKFGLEMPENPSRIIVDYGGPNVAKPLHVGHLRSAVIGESIKRIARYAGHDVIGDIHLGDWGLQMGLIITELKERQPDLLYLTILIREIIPRRLPLPFQNWRKSIPLPAISQRRTLPTKSVLWKLPLNCRAASGDTGRCGIILSACPWRI